MKKTLAILSALLIFSSCVTRQPEGQESAAEEPLAIETPANPTEKAARNNAAISASSVNIIQFDEPGPDDLIAVITTSEGEIKVRLFEEHAPKTVAAFAGLVKNEFYDEQRFTAVAPGYKIECGVTGDAASPFPGEREFSLNLWNFRGAVSLTNNGADFMIVQAPQCLNPRSELEALNFPEKVIDMYIDMGGAPHQDWQNTVFGAVLSGMEVVDKIAASPADEDGSLVNPVVITKIQITTIEE